MKYLVLNTATEYQSEHRTWGAAMNAAHKHPKDQATIIEKDRDGERTYNSDGLILDRDGHFNKKY